VDTAIAGIADNPNSTLSFFERTEAFARRQEAWDTFKPHSITTSKGDAHLPDVIQNGVNFKIYHNDYSNAVAYHLPLNPSQDLNGM
jgi:hypothetical protein